jgi:hypothetical protein
MTQGGRGALRRLPDAAAVALLWLVDREAAGRLAAPGAGR